MKIKKRHPPLELFMQPNCITVITSTLYFKIIFYTNEQRKKLKQFSELNMVHSYQSWKEEVIYLIVQYSINMTSALKVN